MELTIRRMKEKDLECLYLLLSDPRVMKHIEAPYTKEKTAQFLERAGLSSPPLIYAAEKDGEFIGYVIYHDYDEDSVEIGWILYPDCWGRGIASALTEKMIEKASASGKQTVIECSPEQKITKHIAEKYGFTYEGVSEGCDVFRRRNEKL